VTFPAQWAGNNANQPQRGLRPGTPSPQRMLNQMQFGAQTPKINQDLWSDEYGHQTGVESLNPRFNPKTKQVFAALNYGRRPHGSSVTYGKSYLQLAEKLKVNALYYPGDTFTLPEDTSTQVAYGILGAVLAHAGNPQLRRDIVKSCYLSMALPDTKNAELLLEAHLFTAIIFREHLLAVFLPAERRGSSIHSNAKRFAAKYNVKVVLTS